MWAAQILEYWRTQTHKPTSPIFEGEDVNYRPKLFSIKFNRIVLLKKGFLAFHDRNLQKFDNFLSNFGTSILTGEG